jgi:hypothetical protein
MLLGKTVLFCISILLSLFVVPGCGKKEAFYKNVTLKDTINIPLNGVTSKAFISKVYTLQAIGDSIRVNTVDSLTHTEYEIFAESGSY